MLYPAFLCAVMSLSHNRLRVWDRLYLGMLLCLLGIWILLGSLSPVLPFAAMFIILSTFIRREEALMRITFKEEFDDYCRDVRRWL